jgi:predicted unusual protein kinase regulating ubiquinone biosynthesis (AarF/ABC1/UbiB family)
VNCLPVPSHTRLLLYLFSHTYLHYPTIYEHYYSDQFTERSAQRGEELAKLLTKLGPTFIKVGQSLSIRTDLLSPGYVRGLQSLQDQVPPFDTAAARQILEAEWGRPLTSVIEGDLTEKPVAAASLGQVYKATLKGTDQEVAIKVQRPAIIEQIALDMHLLREAAPVAKRTFNLNSDTTGTVDSWATGFVAELDYIQEAKNAEFFSEKIQATPLRDVVFAPAVFKDISTQSVLVSEWVNGERLDRSSSEDVTVLCSIAMNAYLTMMLELGVLHCDPHPGTYIRYSLREQCELDWLD